MTTFLVVGFITLLLSFVAGASALAISAYTLYRSRKEYISQCGELEYRLKASEMRLEKFLEKALNEASEQLLQSAQNNAFDMLQEQRQKEHEMGSGISDIGGFGQL